MKTENPIYPYLSLIAKWLTCGGKEWGVSMKNIPTK